MCYHGALEVFGAMAASRLSWSLQNRTIHEPFPKGIQTPSRRDPECFGPMDFPLTLRPRPARATAAPGTFAGNTIPGYRQEEGIRTDSNTETYVALKLNIDNWRWSNVPFYLRTGKRLAKRVTEIAIQFRSPPMTMFGQDVQYTSAKNQLVLRVQPDEGISLSFGAKVPGMRMRLGDVKMDFRYGSSFGDEEPEAYERLLLDAMLGDSTLFIRADEVEYSWRLITPLLESWASSPPPKFPNYEAGTWGPSQADSLFAGTDACWRRL